MRDWSEYSPAEVGMAGAGLAEAVGLIRDRGAAAQLCVLRGGQVVLDRAIGCAPTSLFWIFSASKPYVAVLVHRLAEQGRLDLDAPVAEYWPEFGRRDKERITVRHVLQHRTGLVTSGNALGDLLAMTDWEHSVHRLENASPRWPPGAVPAYQYLSYGFMLGELVRRASGVDLIQFLRDELLSPIGARDTYLGLPADQWDRHVAFPGGSPVGLVLNRRSIRQAVIPAAGVSTTARDLAVFYQALLSHELLAASTLARATTPSSDGVIDRQARKPIRWSQGFQLGGPRWVPGAITPLGTRSSPLTFGHNGSNCCIAWADPERDLVVAYLTNRLTGKADVRHHAAVADALIGACVT